MWQSKPDTFYRELTKEQVKYLRRNNVKINETHRTKMFESDKETVAEDAPADG